MHLDSEGRPSQALLEYAYINAHFQSGVRSPLDAAIVQAGKGIDVSAWTRQDELAFDFSRRCLSVSARRDNETLLITKGAPEAILAHRGG
jgi:Mg2+-importing ATPase